MAKKHSNVYYVYKNDTGFVAVEKAVGVRNSFGLDLFRHNKRVYEGRTGIGLIAEAEIPNLAGLIEKRGIEKVNELLENHLLKTGESPRYTRPDERKQDIFPPDPAKKNIVLAKDSYGKKHYYFRFEHEGYELFTLKNATENYRRVYIRCEEYMLGIGQHHNLEEIINWLNGLENGIKGEIERQFNESMANPQKWADPGFANVLGRVDDANAHNAPIREARMLESKRRAAEYDAKRIAAKEAEKAEYEQAIKEAEAKISCRQTVSNTNMPDGKSLIMQLFRENGISIPLKTQGWIINALSDIFYDEKHEKWSYRYYSTSKNSTVFSNYLTILALAVQAKQG